MAQDPAPASVTAQDTGATSWERCRPHGERLHGKPGDLPAAEFEALGDRTRSGYRHMTKAGTKLNDKAWGVWLIALLARLA